MVYYALALGSCHRHRLMTHPVTTAILPARVKFFIVAGSFDNVSGRRAEASRIGSLASDEAARGSWTSISDCVRSPS